MDRQEMIRKSGLIPPTSAAALLERNANLGVPTPEPPKPRPAAPQAVAPAVAAPQVTTPAGSVDVVALEDLRQEIKKLIWSVLAESPEKFRGVAGPKGDPGKDVSVIDLRKVIAELIQEAITAAPERFQGRPGRDGKDSTVVGPVGAKGEKGDRGERGERGATGEPSKTILVQTPKEGPQGIQGIQGIRGPAGLDEAAIEQLVVNILTSTNAVSEQAMKIIATTMELEAIATSPEYHRLGVVRDAIVARLRKTLC